jgi:UDP-glucose 4-epimerase
MAVVAVTGCSGYIGSRLLRFIEADDRVSRVVGVDVRPPLKATSKLEFHSLDIRDRALGPLFVDRAVDRVVHLAFIVNPLHNDALMHDIDVTGTRNALAAAEACGAGHLVVASSTSAFGALADNPDWLTEEHPPRRQDNFLYASDKYEVEAMVREFTAAHPGTRVAVVRPCIVYGPNVENYLSRFIMRLPLMPGVGGARPEMQFVHEDDAAEVFMRVLEMEAEGYFHAVGEGTVNISRIAEMAGKRMLDLPPRMLYGAVDLLWKLHAPRIEGPSGMLDFIRYRWTASDEFTRQKLGIVSMRSSEEVVRLTIESNGKRVAGPGSSPD